MQTKQYDHTHVQICHLCEAMCGLKIQTRHSEVISIKGNPDDTFSQGYLCAKALALKDVHEDPNRLRQPMRRTAQGWQSISWETAFGIIKKEFIAIEKKFGRDSIALYLGNPRYHHHGSLLASILLKKALHSRNCFSVASSDHLPHMLAAYHLFGHMALLPVPDLERTDYLLCFGANPLVSNGSVMSAPGIKKRFRALQNRGGTIITIDPRKTETAQLADQHIFIYPGQDTFLLLGIIHLLFKYKLIAQGAWQSYTSGLNELEQLTQIYTLEKVSRLTGIAGNTIEALTQDFAKAKTAAAYGRMGICTQNNGALNAWLIYLLNIITGNLDKPGGLMFPSPATDLALLSALINETGNFDQYRSRLKNLPSFDSELPVVEMADTMLADQADKIRGFINVAGNPVLSTPNGTKLEHALGQLDFMVAVDYYINESNRFADIILPPASPLERSEYNLSCNLTAIRNSARYSGPLFQAPTGAKHDWQILLMLSTTLNHGLSLRAMAIRFISLTFKTLGADGLLDLLLRLGPYGFSFRTSTPGQDMNLLKPPWQHFVGRFALQYTPRKLRLLLRASPFSRRLRLPDSARGKKTGLTLKTLKQNPNGLDLGPLQPNLPHKLLTAGQNINLVPMAYRSALASLAPLSQHDASLTGLADNEFFLIGRRTPRTMNSWLHRVKRLTKGKPANRLFIHPDRARALGIHTDDKIKLTSEQRSLEAIAEIHSNIMPEVVSLPHGWGHDPQQSQGNASSRQVTRASFNDLSSSSHFDTLSGVSVLNAIRVSVSKLPDQTA